MINLIFEMTCAKLKVSRRKNSNMAELLCRLVHIPGHREKDVGMLPTSSLKVIFGHQETLYAPFKE
jgi:hypothetical protein